MLGLGGEVDNLTAVTDEQRIAEMKTARALLRKLTGCDYGYDLAAWHDFFIHNEVHRESYTFPYAWDAVQPKILELIKDLKRLRLAQALGLEE